MKILVTGGAGFIGSHIVEHYSNKAEIVVLDNLRTGRKENISKFNVDFVYGDIRDRDTVSKAVEGVDIIFHLAAMISVPESVLNPLECVAINNKGTLILLEEAVKAGVKKICFSSSCAVYGDNFISPKVESLLPEPKSPYAVSKLDGEYYCNIYSETGKIKTACMRYFNVFGPRQDPLSPYAAAIPIFISKAVKNEPIIIYGDGNQTRDFIYVKDVVRANVFFAENDYIGVYNLGYGKETSLNQIVKQILKTLSSKSKVVYEKEREGDIKHSRACIDKLLKIGFKIEDNFAEGLKETIKYFKSLPR